MDDADDVVVVWIAKAEQEEKDERTIINEKEAANNWRPFKEQQLQQSAGKEDDQGVVVVRVGGPAMIVSSGIAIFIFTNYTHLRAQTNTIENPREKQIIIIIAEIELNGKK